MTDPVALELIGLDPLATAYIQTLAGFIDASTVQPTYVDADDDESSDEVKNEACEQETVPESTNSPKHALLNSFSTGEYRIIPHPGLQGAFQLLPSKRLITQIQILGVITTQEVKSNRISFVVDDGTGSMDCIWWISSDDVVRKDVVNQRDLDSKELRQYEDEEREAAITREIHSIVARRNELERQAIESVAQLEAEIQTMLDPILNGKCTSEVGRAKLSQIRSLLKTYDEGLEQLELFLDAHSEEEQQQVAQYQAQRTILSRAVKQAAVQCEEARTKEVADARGELLGDVSLRKRKWAEKDQLEKAQEVTSGLRRAHDVLRQELEKSEMTQRAMEESSKTLQQVNTEYEGYHSATVEGRRLMRRMEQREFTDKLLFIGAFLLFLMVVLYVLQKRLWRW